MHPYLVMINLAALIVKDESCSGFIREKAQEALDELERIEREREVQDVGS